MKLNLIFLCFMLLHFVTVGQVVINPDFPEDGLFVVNQLYDVTLVNTSSEIIEGHLSITIVKNGTELVLKHSTFPLQLDNIQPIYGRSMNWSPQIEYGSNEAAESLRQGGMLPVGYYIFCYTFYTANNSVNIKSCQEVQIKGMNPPELLEPMNGSIISSVPLLVWMPPMLSSPIKGVRYHLKLVELGSNQSPELGLKQNFPILEVAETAETQMLFSSEMGQMKEGKTYAWQVDAFVKDFSLGTTDVWTFSYGESALKADVSPIAESYRMVKRIPNSGKYTAHSKVFFGYDNRLGERELKYSLVPLNGDKLKENIELPTIELKAGLNQIVLDCSSFGLKNGNKYSLDITDAKGGKYYLDFKFYSKMQKK